MVILKSQRQNRIKQNKTSDNFKKELSFFYKQNDEYIIKILDNLIVDVYNHLPVTKRTRADQSRDRAYLKNALFHQGLSYAAKCLPKLADSLLQYLEAGKSSYPGFKLQPGTEHPRFLGQLFTMIYNPSFCDSNRTWAIKCIYQLGYTFKKLQGPYDPKVLVKKFDEFCEVDKALDAIECDYDVINWAINDINTLFKDVDMHQISLRCHPGPGATNTPRKKYERYEPFVLYKQIDDVLWYEEIFLPSYSNWTRQAQKLRAVQALRPTSRFKFVPKTFSKPRGICIEENEMQYAQQGVKEFLYEHIESHWLTKGYVNFSDQSCNRLRALKGSADRLSATIDMSEASDRISRKLVERLFVNQADIRDLLLALSTRCITAPNDIADKVKYSILEANKYAPMGSGLCFPIMSLVHFTLVRGIIASSKLDNKMALLKEIYVYGDDIILPSVAVETVFSELPKFGMKLNTEKSFYQGEFRESCGLHAYKGVEITPIFIKKINLKARKTETLLSVLAAEYGLRYNGFTRTADLIVEMVTDVEGELPIVTPSSPVLGFRRNTDVHVSDVLTKNTRIRFRASSDLSQQYLQCYEYRVRVVEPVQIKSSLFGYTGLVRKLICEDDHANQSSEATKSFKITWKWLSASAIIR